MSELQPCPVCGHLQPKIYFSSSGPCFDCIYATEPPAVEPPQAVAATDRPADNKPSREAVRATRDQNVHRYLVALVGLPEVQRRAWLGYYESGASLGQIAKDVGVQTPAVSKALARAIEHFLRCGFLFDGNTSEPTGDVAKN